MFNAEPQEKVTAEEIAEFEAHVAQRNRRITKSAILAGFALFLNIVCIVPFLDGNRLHNHWDHFGKYLLVTAGFLLLRFVSKAGSVWASSKAANDTRSELRHLD